MPYLVAAVVIIIGAVAFFVLRAPAEAPTEPLEQTTTAPSAINETVTLQSSSSPAGAEEVPYSGITTEQSSSTPSEEETVSVVNDPSEQSAAAPSGAEYVTYDSSASYFTPRRTEHDIGVTVTLDGTTITRAAVTYDNGPAETPNHIAFDEAYADAVIGKDISTVSLSRVGGASLTSEAFNEAIADIRDQM